VLPYDTITSTPGNAVRVGGSGHLSEIKKAGRWGTRQVIALVDFICSRWKDRRMDSWLCLSPTHYYYGGIVGGMWLTLEYAGESERLFRCLRMIWEIEIECFTAYERDQTDMSFLCLSRECREELGHGGDREIGVVKGSGSATYVLLIHLSLP